MYDFYSFLFLGTGWSLVGSSLQAQNFHLLQPNCANTAGDGLKIRAWDWFSYISYITKWYQKFCSSHSYLGGFPSLHDGLSFLSSSFLLSCISVTWLITAREQNWPGVLWTLLYKGGKFESVENWPHKTQVFHFLFSVYFLFASIQLSNQKSC
jgi:hypothetical protein